MSDQRIHQFKVFRGSSLAKARKEMASSFISKPTDAQKEGTEPCGIALGRRVSTLEELQTQERETHIDAEDTDQVEIHGGLDDTTKNTVTQAPPVTMNKDESLRYIYHEEDSEEQHEGEPAHEMRINQSSIRLDDSGWPVVEQTKHLRLSIEHMRLEEEKMKLELERAQLERKRKEVELLMKEVTLKKRATIHLAKTAETLNDTREMSSNTIKTNGSNTTESFQSAHQSDIKKRRSVRYRVEEQEEPKQAQQFPERKQQLQHKVQRLQKSQHLMRQQRARQAILLQTLWINIIKTNNEIRQVNSYLVKTGFRYIKRVSQAHKLVQAIESVFSLQDLVSAGQAFIRIKKYHPLTKQRKRSPETKRGLVVKFTQRQNRDFNFAEPQLSERAKVCETEESRVESRVLTDRLQVPCQSSQLNLTRSIQLQKGSFTGRPSRTVEIDSIIRSQLNNKPLVSKVNRGNSRDRPQTVVKEIYLKTDNCQLQPEVQLKKKEVRTAVLTKIQIKNISTMVRPAGCNLTVRRLT